MIFYQLAATKKQRIPQWDTLFFIQTFRDYFPSLSFL